MRGSDGVDVAVEVLPRRWVRAILVVLILAALVFDWHAPFTWYIQDKAEGLTEIVSDAMEDMLSGVQDSVAISPTPAE